MLFQKREEKRFQHFVEMISKLEAVEFLAVCRILGVDVVDKESEEGGPLPFEVILEKVLDKFLTLKKKPRRELMSLLENATRK